MSSQIPITLKQWYDQLPGGEQRDTLIDLCQFLGKSEETVYRWIRGAGTPDNANRLAIEQFTHQVFFYNDTPKTAKVA